MYYPHRVIDLLSNKSDNASNNNINANSKYLNKDKLRIKPLINSIYSYFDLKCPQKVWIKWKFELTDFELTVQFNIGEIGIWQRFWERFE